MDVLVTPENFKRFVVLGRDHLAVIGQDGEREEYRLVVNESIPKSLRDLLGNRTGQIDIDDKEGCIMSFTLEDSGTIREIGAGRSYAVPSVSDGFVAYEL